MGLPHGGANSEVVDAEAYTQCSLVYNATPAAGLIASITSSSLPERAPATRIRPEDRFGDKRNIISSYCEVSSRTRTKEKLRQQDECIKRRVQIFRCFS
jgi:hypothetical protein